MGIVGKSPFYLFLNLNFLRSPPLMPDVQYVRKGQKIAPDAPIAKSREM